MRRSVACLLRFLFCFCLLVTLGPVSPVMAHAKSPLPSNVNLVAAGDSVSAGWGSPAIRGVRMNGYVSQLHRQLLTRGQSELHNLGVPGLTSGQFLFLLDHWPEASQYLKQATVITLSIGGNDIIWTDHQSPGDEQKMREALSKFEANIDTSLTKIRWFNPNARLFVLEVYNPFPTHDSRHDTLAPWIQWVNDSIDKSAILHDADVIPTASLFLGHEKEYVNLANNDIHPNVNGHTKIAEQISQQLIGFFNHLVVQPKMQPILLWNGKPVTLASGLFLENETVYVDANDLRHLHQGSLKKLWYRIGEWWARVNGRRVKLHSPVLLKDGHPFLPIRAVAEELGDQVFWVQDSQTISVFTRENFEGKQGKYHGEESVWRRLWRR